MRPRSRLNRVERTVRRLSLCLLALSLVLVGLASGAPQAGLAASATDPLIVYHALWLPHRVGLVPVHVLPPDHMTRAEGALQLLMEGPPSGGGLSRTIPAGTTVLSLEIDDGLATVDFSAAILEHSYGSTGEALLLGSIVNTLAVLPEISQVRILVAGELVESLGGHIDISEPLNYSSAAVYSRGLPDVTGHWAEGHITAFSLTGIVSGYPEGDFRPEQIVTREEFVKMLVLTQGIEPLAVSTPTFTDVAPDRWSSGHIEAAVAQGIILPADYGASFDPSEPPSRREMTVLLVRATGNELLAESLRETELDYTDVADQPAWAIGYIAAATELGLLRGYPDGTFGSGLTLKRSEAVTVLSRLLSLSESHVIMVWPVVGQAVGSQVLIVGAASAFEATVQVRVNSPDGSPFAGTYVTATDGGPNWGVFAALISTPDTTEPFTVETYELSAKDGSEVHLTSREVHRAP